MSESMQGFTITITDVYTKLQDVQLGVIEMKATLNTAVAVTADHETRIRGLERWKYALPISAVSAVFSAWVAYSQATGK